MNGLWMNLPLPVADTSGFATALACTDGIGLIDDTCGCSETFYAEEEIRDGLALRILVSGIGNNDIVFGTEKAILSRIDRAFKELSPKFCLLCGSPISSFIATDMDALAVQIRQKYGVPAAALNITGHKLYDEGLSMTLEALVHLLCPPADVQPTILKHTVNIIGANYLDWSEEDIDGLHSWLSSRNLKPLCFLGADTLSSSIRKMPRAELNLVVNVAGIKAAEYLQRAFGTPYLCGAPFGNPACDSIFSPGISPAPESNEMKVLIICEQFCGNALRLSLEREFGMVGVRVATFGMLERDLARPGDVVIRSEEECSKLLASSKLELVIADPLLKRVLTRDIRWIDFPQITSSARTFALYRAHLLAQRTKRFLAEGLGKNIIDDRSAYAK